MQDLAKWRSRLETMRADVEERLSTARTEGASLEPTKKAGAAQALERRRAEGLHELELIDAAFARLDAGTFGQCVQCGNPIDASRLDVLPFVEMCRACAQAEAALAKVRKAEE